jgi:hypothetical protein
MHMNARRSSCQAGSIAYSDPRAISKGFPEAAAAQVDEYDIVCELDGPLAPHIVAERRYRFACQGDQTLAPALRGSDRQNALAPN